MERIFYLNICFGYLPITQQVKLSSLYCLSKGKSETFKYPLSSKTSPLLSQVRDEAKHTIKKMVKELMKLFNKKTCMDISDGGKIKKNAKDGFNFEAAVSRFQSLSYFDQHVVTNACAASVIEMLNNFSSGNANYIPLAEYIAYLFELMEIALNIHGLIEFTIQVCWYDWYFLNVYGELEMHFF